jgi:hypothetical protein
MAYKPTRRSRTTKASKPAPPSQHQIEREIRRLKRLPLTGGPADAIVNAALETLLWAQGGAHVAIQPPAENVKALQERWAVELEIGGEVMEAAKRQYVTAFTRMYQGQLLRVTVDSATWEAGGTV